MSTIFFLSVSGRFVLEMETDVVIVESMMRRRSICRRIFLASIGALLLIMKVLSGI